MNSNFDFLVIGAGRGGTSLLAGLLDNHPLYLRGKKILFILRDGRSCVNSKVRRTNQPVNTACERWLYSVDCYRFLREKHNNSLCIKFEDLLLNPEHTLSTVCEFLDVEFSKVMLNGVSNKKMLPEYQNTELIRSKADIMKLENKFFIKIQHGLKYSNYI